MTALEMKLALKYCIPIVYTDMYGTKMRFDYVSAIIYKSMQGKLLVSLELTDVERNSVTIARADCVQIEDPERLAVLRRFEEVKPSNTILELDPRMREGAVNV